MKTFTVDKLEVIMESTAQEMGAAAALAIKKDIVRLLDEKDEISVMFAAAPSQNTTLNALISLQGIEWNRINAFHMDEYVGIKKEREQSFRNYLITHIFSKVPFKSVNLIEGDADDIQAAIDDYERKIRKNGLDLIVMGIGENGHIAFNDPPEARFIEDHYVKEVKLAQASRMQQVNDKCFATIDQVPESAITVTIPAFMSASALHCVVPGPTKTNAVRKTLEEPISELCPASILRTHDNAHLYIDEASAADLAMVTK